MFEINLAAKIGRGHYSGKNVFYYSTSNYSSVYFSKVTTDNVADFWCLNGDLRLLKMKKISKIGVAYGFGSLGYIVGSYQTNLQYMENGFWIDTFSSHLDLSGINAQLGVGFTF